jgi:spectinomycin phosphotransferase
MLDKLPISDESLISCLSDNYGLTVAHLEFLPIGYDSLAGTYRVEAADGTAYFVKATANRVGEVSVLLPRYLKSQGIEQVVAPLPAINDDLWGIVDNGTTIYKVLLYPFIDGQSGMSIGLTERQRTEFGVTLRRLHDTHLASDLEVQVRRETFIPTPKWNRLVDYLAKHPLPQEHNSEVEAEFASFFRKKEAILARIASSADELGAQLRRCEMAAQINFVLCHADIHTANVMVTADDRLYIVDWDQPTLAPKERDLMFVIGGGIGAYSEQPLNDAHFLRGYGDTPNEPPDLLAMAYYRNEWVIQDIAEFGETVFFQDWVGDATKQDALRIVKAMFGSGNIVDSALQADMALIASQQE